MSNAINQSEQEKQAILESFIVDNAELRELEHLLAEFNIFEAIGVVRQELKHSEFLAFLLNPSERHGMQDQFLKRFLIKVLNSADSPPMTPIEIDVADFKDAIVERETHNIDILIRDELSNVICLIENKISSTEHDNQLERYLRTVTRRFANADSKIIAIYLTPDGDLPSEEAFIPVSYTTIAKLMDDSLGTIGNRLRDDLTILIQHYITMLRRHILSDSRIAELARIIYAKHKAAIDLIIEHMPDRRQAIADYVADLIQLENHLVPDRHGKSEVDFAPASWDDIPALQESTGWTTSGRMLLFAFVNREDSLNLHLYLGPGPEATRMAVFEQAKDNPKIFNIFARSRQQLWKKYNMLYKLEILKKQDYVDADIEDLQGQISEIWYRFLEDDLPKIEQAILDMNL